MINVSNEFKDLMTEDDRKFLSYLDIVLADGTKLPTIENDDLWDGGFKIDDGVTASGQFTVGSCIINKLTITINNIYDKFSPYDFDGAVVTAYLGLELSGGRIEKIRKGIFTVDEPTYNGSTITLECLDNMYKLDRDYADVKTSYPATLRTIVSDICSVCGVTLLTTTFSNSSYVIQKRPTDDALTCRQVLSYAAQLACCFARCDTYGRLVLKWFEQGVFEEGAVLDGGIFDEGTPYISGDKADGGTFSPWNTGYAADAETFEKQNKFHHLFSYNSLSVSTDDIVITGVQVTDEFEETETEKKQTYLYGNTGYVLSIAGNKSVEKGKAQTVATYLGQKLVGLRFRQMSGQFLSDPTVEAGDLACVTDKKQRTYNCLVTNLTFAIGNYMSVSCDAETPSKNSATRYSELTQAIVEARKSVHVQLNEYDIAVQNMNQLAANTMGFYCTTEKQEDGSIIAYRHDKPLMSDSVVIYKSGIDGFWVSQDGGKTYRAGFDKDGNAVLNMLSVIGINFNWARGGELTLGGGGNGNGRLSIRNAIGAEIGYIDNTGVNFKEGTFSGALSGGRVIGSKVTGTVINSKQSDGSEITIEGGTQKFRGNDTALASDYKSAGSIYVATIRTDLADANVVVENVNVASMVLNAEWIMSMRLRGYTYVTLDKSGEYGNGSQGRQVYFAVPCVFYGETRVSGELYASRLTVSGTKSRVAQTENYASRLLYCYEMPSPMFGDIGQGELDDTGTCLVALGDMFSETVNTRIEYQVFLQKEGPGDIWVDSKESTYFVVRGVPGTRFAWELKAAQSGYEYEHLEECTQEEENEIDYEQEYMDEIEQLIEEQEDILYGENEAA